MQKLSISTFETPGSRLFSMQLDAAQLDQVRDGCLVLDLSNESVRIWSECMNEDLILAISLQERAMVACKIIGKSLRVANNPLESRHRGLILNVSTCGESVITRLPFDVFAYASRKFSTMGHAQFAELWNKCTASKVERAIKLNENIFEDEFWQVRFASSRSDLKFIDKISSYHPFGFATGPITLIASKRGKRVGALIGDFSRNSSRTHPAPWRVFRGAYSDIRRSALRYVRLYDDPSANLKFRTHETLARTYEAIAPSFLFDPLTIIESISYDYHPVAAIRHYNIECPVRDDQSFYFWKPFFLPTVQSHSAEEKIKVRDKVHNILKRRLKRHYFIAPGPDTQIRLSAEKKAWAIRRNAVNTRRWKSLNNRDIILFQNKENRIRSYGVVSQTRVYTHRSYEGYPLWIDFSDVVGLVEIAAANYITPSWYISQNGGLVAVPAEVGAAIKLAVDDKISEDRMFVQPNSYLLHRTQFDVQHSQIFVVQAFEFKDTVLPVIREIFRKNNYVVKYSGDRQGQVIFDDIWLMLNESEIIVVDFTHKRPNVYLEFGMAIVLGKPIIAITQSKDDLPSDTPDLKYILYSDRLGDKTLENLLPIAARDTLADHALHKSTGMSP